MESGVFGEVSPYRSGMPACHSERRGTRKLPPSLSVSSERDSSLGHMPGK